MRPILLAYGPDGRRRQSFDVVRSTELQRAGTVSRPVPLLTARAVVVAAVIAACIIGVLAYLFGDQPFRGDGTEYRRLATIIAHEGIGEFQSDLRTWGYPAFLAAAIVLVGDDLSTLRPAVFVAQLALYLAAAGFGAVRIGRALGSGRLGVASFVVTVLNPLLLFYTVQLLTDVLSAVLVYLAFVCSLPQQPPESRRRVILFGTAAFLLSGLAVMVRPANLMVVPALILVWAVRAWRFRDVLPIAVPLMIVALALPFVPQIEANQRAFRVPQPLIVRSLYAEHLHKGLRHAKYITLGISGLPNRAVYYNPFFPPDAEDLTPAEILARYPQAVVGALALHAFALFDHDYPFAYVRDLDPWYRWPISTLNALFLAAALAGLVGLAAGWKHQTDPSGEHRRFVLVAVTVISAAVLAIYLPSEVESRFSLVLYPLLTVPAVLAVEALPARVRVMRPWHVVAGALLLGSWVVGSAAASIWLQEQAPVLAAIRAQQELPSPEQPLALLDGELPKQWRVDEPQSFSVEIVNLGEQTWSSDGFYPVTMAVRFAALKQSQHEAIGEFGRQYVRLPEDVPPNGSLVVQVDAVAPPLPGRYTLEVQVFRHGLPDPEESLQRIARVDR